MTRLTFAAAVCVLLPACRPAPAPDAPADTAATVAPPAADSPAPAGPVTLTTDRNSYQAGATVSLTLTNADSVQYYFNPCPRVVEREAAGAWAAVDEGQRMCTMEAWILQPRGTRTAQTELPRSLTPGRHRIVISLTAEGGQSAQAVQAVSAPFTVTP